MSADEYNLSPSFRHILRGARKAEWYPPKMAAWLATERGAPYFLALLMARPGGGYELVAQSHPFDVTDPVALNREWLILCERGWERHRNERSKALEELR